MLVNIIQNTISSFRSALAAAEVITTNLKMWLGFETSETLGRELNDLTWVANGGWSINGDIASNDGSGSTLTNAILQVGNTYEFKCKLSSYTSGDFRLMLGSNTISTNFSSTDEFTFIGVCTGDGNARVQSLSGNGSLSISSLSIKKLTITPDKSGNNNVGQLFTGKALYFDGAGYYVDISGFSMSGNNATFAFWAYIEENIKGDYFFDFHSSTTRFILGFGQTSRELALYSKNNQGGAWHDFGDPPQDQWVRIVLTVNGTTAKCFVDGVQLGTDKTISTYVFSSATTTHIGARYEPETSPKFYDGLLSDFQIYNSVWSTDDIAYDYANPQNLVTDRDNPTIALSNLKAYWAMSEGAGSFTYNSAIALGSEEVENGYFSTETTDWSEGTGWDIDVVNNKANVNATSFTDLYQNIGAVSGGTYKIEFKVSDYVSGSVQVTLGYGGSGVGSATVDDDGVYEAIVTTNPTNPHTVYISTRTATTQLSIDYISVKEVSAGTINGATYELAQPRIPQLGMMNWSKPTIGSNVVTLIPDPNNTSQDILGNAVRDRLNSFNLDGSGYAEVADDTDLDIGTGAFTMECWVKADFENTGSGFNNIFILGGEISDTNTTSISINSTKLLAQVSDKELNADSNYTIGDWYHVCVTRDGSNLCTLYIDAEAQLDTETTSASITNTSTKLIGRDTLTSRFYKNLISDVRLYKGKALSGTEIENNFNAGLSAHTND